MPSPELNTRSRRSESMIRNAYQAQRLLRTLSESPKDQVYQLLDLMEKRREFDDYERKKIEAIFTWPIVPEVHKATCMCPICIEAE